METIEQFRKAVDRLRDERRAALLAQEEADRQSKQAQLNLKATQQAQIVAQAIAQQIQQQVHDRIAALVTRCLQAVFGDAHEFKIEMERKRGKTEAKIVFLENGLPIRKASQSGGIKDIAAFALRLASMVIASNPSRRLLVLDEPFKFCHGEEYRTRICHLIDLLAEEMGVQVIFVTGINDLKAGKIVNLK